MLHAFGECLRSIRRTAFVAAGFAFVDELFSSGHASAAIGDRFRQGDAGRIQETLNALTRLGNILQAAMGEEAGSTSIQQLRTSTMFQPADHIGLQPARFVGTELKQHAHLEFTSTFTSMSARYLPVRVPSVFVRGNILLN
jgi:hypothetical protein